MFMPWLMANVEESSVDPGNIKIMYLLKIEMVKYSELMLQQSLSVIILNNNGTSADITFYAL